MYLRQMAVFSKELHPLRHTFFKKIVAGREGIIPQDVFPLFSLSYCFNTLLSRLYVDKYVHPQAVYIANTLGNDLRNVFIRIIQENNWLQPDTKLEAIKKLRTISIETVYPKYLIEDFDIN